MLETCLNALHASMHRSIARIGMPPREYNIEVQSPMPQKRSRNDDFATLMWGGFGACCIDESGEGVMDCADAIKPSADEHRMIIRCKMRDFVPSLPHYVHCFLTARGKDRKMNINLEIIPASNVAHSSW